MTVIRVIFGCLFLHQYTWDGSGCQTECVWGTCLEWNPAYLYHSRTLAEVQSTISKKCRVRLHKRQLERFLGAFFYTSTHFMLVVDRQNVCGVTAWTGIRNISIFEGLWRKLRAKKQWNVWTVCINVNFSNFLVPITSQIHMRWLWLSDRICVGYLHGLPSRYLQHRGSLAEVRNVHSDKCRERVYKENFSDSWVPIPSQIHMWWQWLSDRICVGYLHGLEPGIPPALRQFGGSWERKSRQMSTTCI